MPPYSAYLEPDPRVHLTLREASNLRSGRHREIEREIENLVRTAARLGNLGAYEQVLSELEQVRDQLHRELARRPAPPDIETLRGSVSKRLGELSTWGARPRNDISARGDGRS